MNIFGAVLRVGMRAQMAQSGGIVSLVSTSCKLDRTGLAQYRDVIDSQTVARNEIIIYVPKKFYGKQYAAHSGRGVGRACPPLHGHRPSVSCRPRLRARVRCASDLVQWGVGPDRSKKL
ncbi:hypothetical protein ACJJTC_000718 [Scirpophaga incertulas]